MVPAVSLTTHLYHALTTQFVFLLSSQDSLLLEQPPSQTETN